MTFRAAAVVASGALIAGGLGLFAPSVAAAAPAPDTAYAIIGGVSVGMDPKGVAVSPDDTVFVVNSTSNTLSVIHPGVVFGVASATINVGAGPERVAINPRNNKVYVTNNTGNTVSVISAATENVISTIPGFNRPVGITVVSGDDTVVVANDGGNVGYTVIDGSTDDTVANIGAGPGAGVRPYDLAASPNSDRVFASTNVNPTGAAPCNTSLFSCIAVLNTSTDDTDVRGPLGSSFPAGIAVGPDDTVYALNALNELWTLNGQNLTGLTRVAAPLGAGLGRALAVNTDDTLAVVTGDEIRFFSTDDLTTVTDTVAFNFASQGSIAAASNGVFWVSNISFDRVSAIARVGASDISPATAAPGSPVSFTITPQTANLPVTTATVESVTFGTTTVTGWDSMGNTFTGVAPAGSGTVDVTVNLNGGQQINAGTFTLQPDPTPTPVFPPSAPTGVQAEAGDASVIVSWQAPESTGSFPITTYQVQGMPAGGCLVPASQLTCEVSALTNGTEYSFRVRALNGAGWSSYSSPSERVTPVAPQPPVTPSILIEGTRGMVRDRPGIIVTGVTIGVSRDMNLKPWTRFPGQGSFTKGRAVIAPDQDGQFTWQRRTGEAVVVSIRSEDGSVRSNRLRIPVR